MARRGWGNHKAQAFVPPEQAWVSEDANKSFEEELRSTSPTLSSGFLLLSSLQRHIFCSFPLFRLRLLEFHQPACHSGTRSIIQTYILYLMGKLWLTGSCTGGVDPRPGREIGAPACINLTGYVHINTLIIRPAEARRRLRR